MSKSEEKDMVTLGIPLNLDPSYRFKHAEFFELSAGCGLRYIYGWYIGGMLLQGYTLGYYQYSNIKNGFYYDHPSTPGQNDDYRGISYKSHGFAGGIGMEVALFSYFGVFCEYTNGYNKTFPAGKNAEAAVFRFGVTLRTSYL